MAHRRLSGRDIGEPSTRCGGVVGDGAPAVAVSGCRCVTNQGAVAGMVDGSPPRGVGVGGEWSTIGGAGGWVMAHRYRVVVGSGA